MSDLEVDVKSRTKGDLRSLLAVGCSIKGWEERRKASRKPRGDNIKWGVKPFIRRNIRVVHHQMRKRNNLKLGNGVGRWSVKKESKTGTSRQYLSGPAAAAVRVSAHPGWRSLTMHLPQGQIFSALVVSLLNLSRLSSPLFFKCNTPKGIQQRTLGLKKEKFCLPFLTNGIPPSVLKLTHLHATNP